uniref:Gustatory receptor-like 1 n=1 Tax=Nematostella vectensis TaxID=45351 RepID=A0A0C5GSD5_NEMVE|nr:gustatory receptor-like 1 [Nematostella vectensis]
MAVPVGAYPEEEISHQTPRRRTNFLNKTNMNSTREESLESAEFPSKQQEQDEANQKTSLALVRKVLKTLLFPLILLGIVDTYIYTDAALKPSSVHPTEVDSGSARFRCKDAFLKIYCFLIGVLLYAALFGSITFTLRASDFHTISRLAALDIWSLLCAGQWTACLLTMSRRSGGSKYSKFVRALVFADSNGVPPASKAVKFVTVASLVILVSQMFFIPVLINLPKAYIFRNKFQMFLFGKENMTITSQHGWVLGLFAVAPPFQSIAWIIPTGFYITTCLLLAARFSNVTNKARCAIDNDGYVDISFIRRDHLRLCQAVHALDAILSPIALISYGCNIPLVCIFLDMIIGMLSNKEEAFTIVLATFWCIMNISNTVLCSLAGAHLNSAAHSLTGVVYEVDVKKLDADEKAELMLVLNKLNTEVTSPTIGGIVPITRGMLLTVFGTILGYLTILVQFK